MRIKKLLFMLVLLTIAGRVSADNTLSVSPVTIDPGTTTEDGIAINLSNESEFSAFQFDLILPKGVTLALYEGALDAWLNDSRLPRYGRQKEITHSLSLSEPKENEDGSTQYRFLSYSSQNQTFLDNSGPLVYFNIAVDASANGEKTAQLTNIIFSSSGGESGIEGGTNFADVQFKITVNGQATEITEEFLKGKVHLSETEYTYDGLAHYPTVTIDGLKNQNSPEDTEYDFTLSWGKVGEEGFNLAAGDIVDAGEYAVYINPHGSNYTGGAIGGTFVINPAPVTVSGITAMEKAFDGTTIATLNYDNVVFAGKVEKDKLSVTADGEYTDANAGTNKTVNLSNLTLTGESVSNYKLAETGQQTTITNAVITAKVVNNPTITLQNTKYAFTGEQIQPAVTSVKDGDTEIPQDQYDVNYGENVNVGSGTVEIVGKANGNYTFAGTTSVTFEITGVAAKVTTAPTAANGLTYTGSELALLSNPGVADGGEMQFSLEEKGTYSTDIPTKKDAGNYLVYYKAHATNSNYSDSEVKSVEVTISPKVVNNPVIEVSGSPFIFDNQEKKPSVTVKDVTTEIPTSEYEVSYSNNINAGTATIAITDKDGGNYTVSGQTTFEIGKATAQVTAPTPKTGLVYTGEPQALVTEGSTTGGEMQYSLDNQTYGAAIPTATNAKDAYTVYYKVVGGANYEDVAPASVSVTIAKATISPTVTLESWNFGESAKEPVVEGNPGNGDVTYQYKKQTEDDTKYVEAKPTNVGKYTVKAIVAESDNYQGGTATANFDIIGILAKVTTAPTAAEKLTYSKSAQPLLSNPGVAEGGEMRYSLTENGEYTTAIPTQTDAGDYKVYYMAASTDDNHSDSEIGFIEVSIAPKAVTVGGVKAADKDYDGNIEVTVDVSGATFDGIIAGDELSITYREAFFSSSDAGENIDVYLKDVNLGGASAKNYALTSTEVHTTATINKAKITPTVTITGWEFGKYDAAMNAPELGENSNPGNGAVTYTYKVKDAADDTYSATVPTAVNNYTVKATIAETKNYKEGSATADFAITKTLASATAPRAITTLVYTGEDQVLIEAGTPTGGTMAYKLDDGEYSSELPKAKLANKEYKVYYKVVPDNDHAEFVANDPVTVTIAPKEVTITANDVSRKYGEANAFTYKSEGWATGEGETALKTPVSFDCDATTTTDVGEYAVTPKDATADNYTFKYVAGKLTITKADGELAYEKASDTKTFGDAAFTVAFTKKTEGGEVTYMSNNDNVATVDAAGEITIVGAGNATITATLKASKNYTEATSTFALTVNPKIIATLDASFDPDEIEYDGTEKSPTLIVRDGETVLVGGTDYDVTGNEKGTDYGTYTATITLKGNYSGTGTAQFKITKRLIHRSTVEVRLSADEFAANGTAREPEVTITDDGKTLVKGTDFTVAYADNVNVGKAKVTITGINNYESTREATFTIYREFTASSEWTTYYSAEDLSLEGTSLKAYAITAIDASAGTVTVGEPLNYLKKETPLLVQNTGSETSFKLYAPESAVAEVSSVAQFVGTATASTAITGYSGIYVLVNGVFVEAKSGSIPAQRCYLQLSSPSARSLTIVGAADSTTGIEPVVETEESSDNWYDLKGNRIMQPTRKGLYIKNGKKVVIK